MSSKPRKTKPVSVADTIADLKVEIEKNLAIIDRALATIHDDQLELVRLANESLTTAQTAPAETPAKKPVRTKVGKAKAAPAPAPVAEPTGFTPPHRRTPASVRLTPHEVTLNIGSHPVKELAEADAKDFLNNPKVFWYRPTQFPDPRRYQVQPRIESARAVQRNDPKFTRAPWTVSVTIALIGDDKRCDSWGAGVYTKNKADQE